VRARMMRDAVCAPLWQTMLDHARSCAFIANYFCEIGTPEAFFSAARAPARMLTAS